MNFYYAEQHRQLLVDCPPKDYKSLNIIAYRWIFDQDDVFNYQSQFEKDMNRKKPPRRYNDMSDLEKCDRMALSMFTSKESAENQFNFFKIVQQMGENAYLYLGKHIAMGTIEEKDGVNEIPANKFGHFNHHPVAGFNYHQQFKIISKL
jgi:hypothetical protein